MITAAQIATYLINMREAQSDYMDRLVKQEKLGHNDVYSNRMIAAILNCYATIIDDYFSQALYSGGYFITTYNFFDVEEVKNVIFRINKICDTNDFLDL